MIVLLIRISHPKALPLKLHGADAQPEEPTSPIHYSTCSHAGQEPRLGILFNSIGLQVIGPSTWPLAVRPLVITSSTVQNFETNAT
jgi:hypothetical protein